MKSHIFGDSHARFCFSGMPGSVNHAVNSMTMYRVGRDGPEAMNCNVADGDIVFFLFGEIDCRCHIERQVLLGREYQEVVDKLLDSYFHTLNLISPLCRKIVVCIPPPMRYSDYLLNNCPLPSDFPFPFIGSDERRVQITRDMNDGLRKRCRIYGFHFLDFYDHYAREDGTLKYEMSDKICHILDNEYILKEAQEIL